MTEREFEEAVARATGETVETINLLGFSFLEPVLFDDLDDERSDDDRTSDS